LNEVVRIPFIEYLAVFLMAGLIALALWIVAKFRKPEAEFVKVEREP
jgi:hypothetical protein